MISPGLCVGNKTTIATTPVPNSISTRVPRNSAANSANKDGFELILSASQAVIWDSEVVYQGGCSTGIPDQVFHPDRCPAKVTAAGHFHLTFQLSFLR